MRDASDGLTFGDRARALQAAYPHLKLRAACSPSSGFYVAIDTVPAVEAQWPTADEAIAWLCRTAATFAATSFPADPFAGLAALALHYPALKLSIEVRPTDKGAIRYVGKVNWAPHTNSRTMDSTVATWSPERVLEELTRVLSRGFTRFYVETPEVRELGLFEVSDGE